MPELHELTPLEQVEQLKSMLGEQQRTSKVFQSRMLREQTLSEQLELRAITAEEVAVQLQAQVKLLTETVETLEAKIAETEPTPAPKGDKK